MRNSIIIAFCAWIAFFAVWFGTTHEQYADTCNAPCAVKFPEGTQEDDFKIDWHDGKLFVSKLQEGHN